MQYAPHYAPYCSATIAQALVGVSPDGAWIPDPYGERAETQPASTEQEIAIQQNYWTV